MASGPLPVPSAPKRGLVIPLVGLSIHVVSTVHVHRHALQVVGALVVVVVVLVVIVVVIAIVMVVMVTVDIVAV